jgi:hypothetical protein
MKRKSSEYYEKNYSYLKYEIGLNGPETIILDFEKSSYSALSKSLKN